MAMRTINVHRTRTGVRLRLREFLDRGNGIAPYFMVMPVLLIILLVAVYPIIDSILLSLLDNPLLNGGTEFVGLRNYLQLLHDSVFEAAIGTTIFFSIATVALETVFGFGIALLINGTFPGRGLVRAVILIPWAFPTIVSAQIWSLMFNDRRGIITSILQFLHLLAPGDTLLRTTPGIMTAAIITDVWKTTPFMAILILAGLQVIPGELYEAAEVDGSNRWQRFRSITLPMLTGPLLIALLFRTLDAFRVFDLFYILAGRQVLTLSSYAYYYMFSGSGNDFSIGVAAAVILFAGGLCISLVYVLLLRLMRR
jgi:ABC-type sugar transport system permease subunit